MGIKRWSHAGIYLRGDSQGRAEAVRLHEINL